MNKIVSIFNHEPFIVEEDSLFNSYTQLSRERRVMDILSQLDMGRTELKQRMRANTMLSRLTEKIGASVLAKDISCRFSPFDDTCIMIDFTQSVRHVHVELYTDEEAIESEFEEATLYYVDNGESFWEGNSIARIAERLKKLL